MSVVCGRLPDDHDMPENDVNADQARTYANDHARQSDRRGKTTLSKGTIAT